MLVFAVLFIFSIQALLHPITRDADSVDMWVSAAVTLQRGCGGHQFIVDPDIEAGVNILVLAVLALRMSITPEVRFSGVVQLQQKARWYEAIK